MDTGQQAAAQFRRNRSAAMKAMVLAAGRGSRLGTLTDGRPKALVEVGGVTLLEHVLRRLGAAGVSDVIINLHHHGDQIPPFVESHHRFGLRRVVFSPEPELLDTGGGLKNAAWFFEDRRAFFVHNVDVLSDIDLRHMYQRHEHSGAVATLAAMPRKTTRPLLFDNEQRLVGRRKSSGEDTFVRAPHGDVQALGFCGIQIVSPALLGRMTECHAFPLVDCYLRLAAAGEPIFAHRVDGARWRDCGRPEDLRPL